MEDLKLIFIPGPGIGHITSAIKVGKLILSRDTRLSITYLLINDPVVREYTSSSRVDSDPHPRLQFLNLPELEPGRQSSSDFRTKSELPPIKVVEHIDGHKPLVRAAVLGMMATKTLVIGFVVDMFCLSIIDVADEFSIPSYVFFTSGAGFLSVMLHMQRFADENGVGIPEFKGSDKEFAVAGFLNPVPAKVLPSAMLDRNGGSEIVMATARRIRKTRGVFINTFHELEPTIIQSLSNSKNGDEIEIPPIYPVGPLLKLESSPESEFSGIITWLDRQPRSSVVFLCFGSMGSFSEAQIRQVAAALESSGRRFLWSLRRRKEGPADSPIPVEILPEGFLERTEGVGESDRMGAAGGGAVARRRGRLRLPLRVELDFGDDEVVPRNDEVAPRNNEVRNGQLAPEKNWQVRNAKDEPELCESELMRVRKNEPELCESELMRVRKNELEAELLRRQNAELEPELQFKGPITRLRAKRLQGYFQVLIRKKFEDLEDARCSHNLVNLLTNEDRI